MDNPKQPPLACLEGLTSAYICIRFWLYFDTPHFVSCFFINTTYHITSFWWVRNENYRPRWLRNTLPISVSLRIGSLRIRICSAIMIRTSLNQAKFIATTKSIRSSTAKFRYDEYFDINFDSCRVIISRTSCAGTRPKTSCSFFFLKPLRKEPSNKK